MANRVFAIFLSLVGVKNNIGYPLKPNFPLIAVTHAQSTPTVRNILHSYSLFASRLITAK